MMLRHVSFCAAALLLSSTALAQTAAPAAAAAAPLSPTYQLDIAWTLMCAFLIFMMQAGFAMLEAGHVRAKNTVNVLMKNFLDCCIGSIAFWLLGYGVMFGASAAGWVGSDSFAAQSLNPQGMAQMLFQMMFVTTAITIVSGAMAERTHLNGYIVGAVVISSVIYPVFGHWAWNPNGWLNQLGFIDFAGSSVVHVIGAWCAVAGCLMVGPRLGRFDPETGEARDLPGHNLTLVALGGFILWFAWFGFNVGSTQAYNDQLPRIALNTHFGACAGALGALLMNYLYKQPILLTMTINGALAGLVSITAGCASMTPTFALVTAFIGGMLVPVGSRLMLRLKIDDVVDAFAVHGFAGMWGTLAAGLFYAPDMFNIDRVLVQALGVAVALAWAFPVAMAMYWLVGKTVGLRVKLLHEQRGLDISEHHEVAYPEFQKVTFKTTH